jgi:hypothetical protein
MDAPLLQPATQPDEVRGDRLVINGVGDPDNQAADEFG